MTRCERIDLASGWQWKERDPSLPVSTEDIGWTPATSFPSEIHVELLASGKIEDPYIGFNEHDVQWIGEREWLYRSQFDAPAVKAPFYDLELEGLDTICDVYLNGELILSANNMFRSYTIPVSSLVRDEGNTLVLHFKSAKLVAKELEAKYGKVRAGSVNLGDPSRVYVRKAQYDWRWDWGPELMTCGPYRPIRLVAYLARISSVDLAALVSEGHASTISGAISVEGDSNHADHVRIRLAHPSDGYIIYEESIGLEPTEAKNISSATARWDVTRKVELWWPAGHGEQHLYELTVYLIDKSSNVIENHSQKIGFRRIELVQDPLQDADQYGKGTTFYFRVNGVPIFTGGSNWIPADNFLTTVTPERYRAWLTLARDGGQNIIRLWGGGIYEPEVFYDLCDELGLLVWQDFQFACGVYPAHDEFVESVRHEAVQVVRRLRKHPSTALFCGNNEDYQQVLQWGDVADLPARKLYEDVLPGIVSRYAPEVAYHRGSPYGGEGWDTADPTVGDVHQWNVWAGKGLPLQDYDRLGGRFVSEFGVPAMPALRTVEYWMGAKKDDARERRPQGRLMAQHCKAGAHQKRFAVLMNENLRLTDDLETYIYNTQMLQAEAVGYAYRSWRREWRGPGREFCGGALVWQLNDCWSVTSWAIIDYFLRPKPAYYAIKRELAPFTVGTFRTVEKNRAHDRPRQFYEFGNFQATAAVVDVWGTNATRAPRAVFLEVTLVDLGASGWTHAVETSAHVLAPNAATELARVSVPAPRGTKGPDAAGATVVVGVVLRDAETREVVARTADWPQPLALLDFPDPGLHVAVARAADGDANVTISVASPVKGLFLQAAPDGDHDREVVWDDNALDVMPGDPRVVVAKGLGSRRVQAAYMGREKARYVDES